TDVEAAAVREVDDPLDLVGEVLCGGGVASGQVGGEERRKGHPVRYVEDGVAAIRDQRPFGVFDGGNHLPVRGVTVSSRETAVADVDRAGTVPQIAEDVRTGFAGEEFGEFLARELELRLVLRVDGDEFAAGGAWRVLRVAHQ